MDPVSFSLLLLGIMMAFAFGCASMLPLLVARGLPVQEEADRKKSLSELLGSLLDTLLIIYDIFPVFWIFKSIKGMPAATQAAVKVWKSEQQVRVCFYFFLASSAATLLYAIGIYRWG